MKFNLEYDHVKENVLTNVLPHLEHIETREILMNVLMLDLARDTNKPHTFTNTVLLGSGLYLWGLPLTGPFWTILTASALGVSVINLRNCRKENKGFFVLKSYLLQYLDNKGLKENEIQEALDSITGEDFIEFLENSSYNM